MIEMVARDGPPDAMLCPALICDACRTQVVGDGNIYYMDRYVDGRRQTSPLFVSHKPCSRAVEALLKTLYPATDGWLDLCNEIRYFLPQLTNNSQHAFADDHDGDYLDHDVVHVEGGTLPHIPQRPATRSE